MQNLMNLQRFGFQKNAPRNVVIPDAAGLQFDGTDDYTTLGNLGSFGSNLGNGLYIEFEVAGTDALSSFGYGIFLTGATRIRIDLTTTITLDLYDNNGLRLQGSAAGYSSLNNGSKHKVIITANPATNTITINIDGVNQTVTYTHQGTPAVFSNLTGQFSIGAENPNQFNNAYQRFYAGKIYYFKIGTSASVLYGNYALNEGTGTSITNTGIAGGIGSVVGATWFTD